VRSLANPNPNIEGHPDRAWTSGLAYGTGSAANAGQLADCREYYNLRGTLDLLRSIQRTPLANITGTVTCTSSSAGLHLLVRFPHIELCNTNRPQPRDLQEPWDELPGILPDMVVIRRRRLPFVHDYLVALCREPRSSYAVIISCDGMGVEQSVSDPDPRSLLDALPIRKILTV
jgi:hypothetical protein